MLAMTALRDFVSNASTFIAFDADFGLDVRVLATMLVMAIGAVSLPDSHPRWRVPSRSRGSSQERCPRHRRRIGGRIRKRTRRRARWRSR